MEKPKKQFKSQSVNDLFRQQAASKAAGSHSTSTKLERSKSPGNTKLRLVSKKTRTASTVTLSKLKKISSTSSSVSPKSNPETPLSISPSPAPSSEDGAKESKKKLEDIDPIQKLPETIRNSINLNNNTAVGSDDHQEPANGSTINNPPKSRFNWNESMTSSASSGMDLWDDLQKDLENKYKQDSYVNPPGQDHTTWSPSSKISSFRNSIGTPLNRSPLTRPVESSLSSPFFNDLNQPPHSSFSSRQKSEIYTSRPTFTNNDHSHTPTSAANVGEFWKSPSIWNSHEERQLSTKSDSVLSWSPFDIDSLNLEDPRSKHNASNSLRHQHSFDVGSRSRFFPGGPDDHQPPFQPQFTQQHQPPISTGGSIDFPSNRGVSNPLVPVQHQPKPHHQQNYPLISHVQSIPSFVGTSPIQQPAPRQFPDRQKTSEPTMPQLKEQIPTELIVSSAKIGEDIFSSASSEQQKTTIPVSLPLSSRDSSSVEKPATRTHDYELPHYPEGFASTFYKRGINNFMFIRELQPKIITSKYSDSVEVRLTFPAWDEEYRMKSGKVDIEMKELDGKLGGLKVSKAPPVKKPFRSGFNRGLYKERRV